MRNTFKLLLAASILTLGACTENTSTQAHKDAETTNRTMAQVSATQPVPVIEWSLERHLVIQLYMQRNANAATSSVWRSDLGTIEGHCATIGFGIPYDTSLTNPLVATARSSDSKFVKESLTSIEQSEPNSLYASKNTSATWVNCVGEGGLIEPIYVEAKVTSYPYPIEVNYETNRVIKAGKATVTLNPNR